MTEPPADAPAADLPTRARTLALELHAGQLRKGTGTSYVDGHLDPVAALVRDAGGTDVQVAAAYLHDAAEDAGGRATLDRIAAEVDPHVAELVAALSDSLVDTTDHITKVPWLDRKPAYVAKLAAEPDEVLEVSVADSSTTPVRSSPTTAMPARRPGPSSTSSGPSTSSGTTRRSPRCSGGGCPTTRSPLR